MVLISTFRKKSSASITMQLATNASVQARPTPAAPGRQRKALWQLINAIAPLNSTLFISPTNAIIGAVAGYLALWSVFWLFKLVTCKDCMGYGDFKLLAALGAWLGWQQLPIIIMMSAIVGAVINIVMIVARGKDRSIPIPFGPYLAAAGWITMLWGETIKNTYIDLMF